MKVDGSCHCGAIRFEADVTPGTIWICHCTDSRRYHSATRRAGFTGDADLASFSPSVAEYPGISAESRYATMRPHRAQPLECQPVIEFACAKLPPVRCAADAGCWASPARVREFA